MYLKRGSQSVQALPHRNRLKVWLSMNDGTKYGAKVRYQKTALVVDDQHPPRSLANCRGFQFAQHPRSFVDPKGDEFSTVLACGD